MKMGSQKQVCCKLAYWVSHLYSASQGSLKPYCSMRGLRASCSFSVSTIDRATASVVPPMLAM